MMGASANWRMTKIEACNQMCDICDANAPLYLWRFLALCSRNVLILLYLPNPNMIGEL